VTNTGLSGPCSPQLISLMRRIDFPVFIHTEFGGNARKSWAWTDSSAKTTQKAEISLLFPCLTGNSGGTWFAIDWDHNRQAPRPAAHSQLPRSPAMRNGARAPPLRFDHPSRSPAYTLRLLGNFLLRKIESFRPKRRSASRPLERPMRVPDTSWGRFDGAASERGARVKEIPSRDLVMARASHRRPGPEQSSSNFSVPRRLIIRSMPYLGSIARIRTAEATRHTKLRHQ
jgi:hypothetical protein